MAVIPLNDLIVAEQAPIGQAEFGHSCAVDSWGMNGKSFQALLVHADGIVELAARSQRIPEHC
jgi:hypothetical protein